MMALLGCHLLSGYYVPGSVLSLVWQSAFSSFEQPYQVITSIRPVGQKWRLSSGQMKHTSGGKQARTPPAPQTGWLWYVQNSGEGAGGGQVLLRGGVGWGGTGLGRLLTPRSSYIIRGAQGRTQVLGLCSELTEHLQTVTVEPYTCVWPF